jgi:hypothetical protein
MTIEKNGADKIMTVERIDILNDSLDDGLNTKVVGSDELVAQVESGKLPQQGFFLVQDTGELVDLEFDS